MVSEGDTDGMKEDGREVGAGLVFCETTLGRVEEVLVEIPVNVAVVTVQGVTEVEVFGALCIIATFCTDDCAKVVDVDVAAL